MKIIWKNRELIYQLTKREVAGRYKGSYLGVLWSFLTPILMLLVYTYVFGVVFKARWDNVQTDSQAQFALILFCGLIAFNIFSEVVSKAPNLILSNVNYVKKVVFPLEVLPLMLLGSSLTQGAINLFILLLAQILIVGSIHLTIVLIPVVLLPVALLALGLGWLLSSLGVFLRDMGHIIGLILTVLMFLSPIFYPVSAIPNDMRYIYQINPITAVVENMRLVVIWGQSPDWGTWLTGLLIGVVFFILGYLWFVKSKKAFADII